MINFLLRLFGYEIVKKGEINGLKELVQEKSKKINKYFKELKNIELEYNLLLRHFKEIRSELDIYEQNSGFIDKITSSVDNIKELLTESNLRTLSELISTVQTDIVRESSRSNLTEKDIAYRAGAIDCTNSIINRLLGIKKDIEGVKKEIVNEWSD